MVSRSAVRAAAGVSVVVGAPLVWLLTRAEVRARARVAAAAIAGNQGAAAAPAGDRAEVQNVPAAAAGMLRPLIHGLRANQPAGFGALPHDEQVRRITEAAAAAATVMGAGLDPGDGAARASRWDGGETTVEPYLEQARHPEQEAAAGVLEGEARPPLRLFHSADGTPVPVPVVRRDTGKVVELLPLDTEFCVQERKFGAYAVIGFLGDAYVRQPVDVRSAFHWLRFDPAPYLPDPEPAVPPAAPVLEPDVDPGDSRRPDAPPREG